MAAFLICDRSVLPFSTQQLCQLPHGSWSVPKRIRAVAFQLLSIAAAARMATLPSVLCARQLRAGNNGTKRDWQIVNVPNSANFLMTPMRKRQQGATESGLNFIPDNA
ncbi:MULTISPECIES: hypothetical protein [unclassified Rhizobium]|uniref:hypothetical protein n=1 Tax=unclassified Rhizobium TaxID=2613769 RepID=UPI001ADA838D|nr:MULTISPECIES: hypothetical protein [unclassified Rhizobium]MBO9123943.1 hypothetical protein [Rhizobium sp. 16-488-2b]MBO9174475.1 hypothetical protein [Rhizobium sp. 16-488-2a]